MDDHIPAGLRKRVRAANRLSALKVSKLKEPGLYEDGAGLRLVISEKGSKRWVVRVTINGKRVERGLGIWPTISLEDARAEADRFRRAARTGQDARVEHRRERNKAGSTFRSVFEAHFEIRRQHLKNAKHVQQWESSMRDYVFPTIGDLSVSDISADDVLSVLKPIWFTKPETASRVLQRMSAIFDSAILRGLRERANPCVGVRAELGTSHRVVQHHPALPWREVPAFVVNLRGMKALDATKLALEFLILTACRSGEVRNAPWSEFDIPARLWKIPAARMKGNVEHSVPLAGRALEILTAARELHECPLVFPGTNRRALSDNTFSKLMRDAGMMGCPHGFRSSFKDWAASSGVRDEVSEAALAHADPNKVRGAYRRTKFLEERVELMARWAGHVLNETVLHGGN